MDIQYKPSFIKQFNKLEKNLQEEIISTIEKLKVRDNHIKLKVHKLHGKLRKYFSCYVNYSIRVIFDYDSDGQIILVMLGDHDIYR